MALKTKEDFIRFIEDRAIEKWDSGAPYMLSSIGTETAVNGDDYRPLISPLKLRQFVLTTEFEKVRTVVHPHHKAAVALVPKAADFSFPEVASEPQDEPVDGEDRVAPGRPSRFSPAARLLGILGRLSEEELGRVNIPVDLLVKLNNLK